MVRIVVDPQPCFPLSPYLYMQFMEPLGTTDGSVEAAWDHRRADWRDDVVEITRYLAPGCIRWGGVFSSYYKWREAVGPRALRKPMQNLAWGGIESNQVGTCEFVDFCRRVGAEPLMCVNFLGDGRPEYLGATCGENRAGDADEAADWVSYCNDPDDRLRLSHGRPEPLRIGLWQIGNETSYHPKGFRLEETIRHTLRFGRAMKERDPSIRLIGWGDRDRSGRLWAPRLLSETGDLLDCVAMHMMGLRPQRKDTVLTGWKYRHHPERAWAELLEIYDLIEPRLAGMVEAVEKHGKGQKIAVTEGHLSLRPYNTHPILLEWQAGLFSARVANLYERYGRHVHIATMADFCGTRWTVNAMMVPVPTGSARSYLTPTGTVMQLFGTQMGEWALPVAAPASPLDVTASGSGDRIFLHIVNTDVHSSTPVDIKVRGRRIAAARAHVVAPESLAVAVSEVEPDIFAPQTLDLVPGDAVSWQCPKAAVAAVALDVAALEAR